MDKLRKAIGWIRSRSLIEKIGYFGIINSISYLAVNSNYPGILYQATEWNQKAFKYDNQGLAISTDLLVVWLVLLFTSLIIIFSGKDKDPNLPSTPDKPTTE